MPAGGRVASLVARRGAPPRDVVVFMAGVAAVAFAVLVPAHVVVLRGTPRLVMPVLAAASGLVCLVLARLTHGRTVPDRRLGLVMVAVAATPVVDSLVHLGLTHQLEQTAVLMLAVVAIGAVVERRAAVLLSLVATGTWVLLVRVERLGPPHLVLHYAFGLALALLLAAAVHRVRSRTEERLQAAGEEMDAVAAVARCGHTGADARPVAVEAVQRLVAATAVAWVEADGELVRAACGAGVPGVDLTGVTVPQARARIISRCLQTGQRVFLPEGPAEREVNPQLLQLTGSRSVLLEPVVHGGSVLAVLVVGWQQPILELPERVARVVTTLAAEAGASVSASRLRAALQAMATTDPMTGIHNRRGWNEQLDRLTASARRSGRPLTLAIGDLDHFKRYNDSRGHDAGDLLLRGFADVAGRVLRDVDVRCRWGGEEFAFALPDCGADEACEALDRLRRNVPDGQTSSFGLAVWQPGESVTDCMVRADAALYRAKTRGRDQVCR